METKTMTQTKASTAMARLADDLKSEITLTQSVRVCCTHEMMEMNVNKEEYTKSRDDYMLASEMMLHFGILEEYVNKGDEKRAEGFIRFTIYQMERIHHPRILALEYEPKEFDLFDIKRMSYTSTMYRTFKRFLSHFE